MTSKRRDAFKIKGGAGFFDDRRRLQKLAELGDPLMRLNEHIDWEIFRPDLMRLYEKERKAYLKVRGRWVYLYRAVDARGRTTDFRLSPKRDVAAAKAFFRKTFKTQRCVPRTITLDGYPGLPSGRSRALCRASKATGHQAPLVPISQQYR